MRKRKWKKMMKRREVEKDENDKMENEEDKVEKDEDLYEKR